MNKYFLLTEQIKSGTAFAYTEGKTPLSHELIPEMKDKTNVPFDLFLKKVVISKGETSVSSDISGLKHLWLDFQPNNLAWPLMSEKMKNIIDNNLTGKEDISWMKVTVKADSESRAYFILKFEKMLDVLDEKKTLFVQGTNLIIKPVFSLSKISNYNIFHKPQPFWEIPSGLYISEIIKKAVQKENLTGIDFENVSVA
ncbi:MAG: hypothetical protein HXX16_11480 [Bacteroidales bacterium]|nr:hypothetical protein [Bacteroidales bacterium]